MRLNPIPRLWNGETATVLATGPSLTVAQCRAAQRVGYTIAVNDAGLLFPEADMLYACDKRWWDWNKGAPEFPGARVTHDAAAAELYGLIEVHCKNSSKGFSTDPAHTTCGGSSAYQAANLALLLGASRILLLGVDNKPGADGRTHYFGEHPDGSGAKAWGIYETSWRRAAENLPDDVELINCTPGSALDCLPRADIFALAGHRP